MRLAAVYMASGFGRRFGENKLVYPLGNRLLYQHGFCHLRKALYNLDTAGIVSSQLIVVSQYPDILHWCRCYDAVIQMNTQAAEGISASIRLGVRRAGNVDAYAFFVADQPLLKTATIENFLKNFITSGKKLGCMQTKGRKGNPSVFLAEYKEQLLQLEGDTGGSRILRDHHPDQIWYQQALAEELDDIDTKKAADILTDKILYGEDLDSDTYD